MIDSKGKEVVRYTYNSWGKVISITGSMAETLGKRNLFRYRGCYYDTETGLYYVSSRYYDPEICRWINEDGLNGGRTRPDVIGIAKNGVNKMSNMLSSNPGTVGKIVTWVRNIFK